MKKRVLFGMMIAAFSLFCGEVTEKVRVSPKDVYLDGQDIFVRVNGELFPVNSICRDSEGFYARLAYEAQNYGFKWLCDCGTWNFGSDDVCRGCARGRYKYDE